MVLDIFQPHSVNVYSGSGSGVPGAGISDVPMMYNDPVQPHTSLIFDIKTSETNYKLQLSKLLACCSPLKSNVTSSNAFTKTVRRLIAHHTELSRLIITNDQIECMGNFIDWCGSAIPIYENYIDQYQLNKDMVDMEVQLKKTPLIRINQFNKFLVKLKDVNKKLNISMFCNHQNILSNFNQLVILAKNKIESENLSLDLNCFYFDKVKELDDYYTTTVGYFETSDILKRDYFKFEILHPVFQKNDLLVEVFHLKNNTLAICSVESVGRSLMFPPLKLNEFELTNNDLSLIHLVKFLENRDGIHNYGKIELKFTCPEEEQTLEWNKIFETLNNFDQHEVFTRRHEKLHTLKNARVGLGLHMNQETLGGGTGLRRSSPMIAKHTSLNYHQHSHQNRFILSEVSSSQLNSQEHDLSTPFLDESDYFNSFLDDVENALGNNDTNITIDVSPKLKDISTSPLQIKKPTALYGKEDQNNSTASLPNLKQSSKSLNISHQLASSTSDLSRFDNIKPDFKVKRRKSIFNIFSKKNREIDDEPEFEIVTKESLSKSTSLKSLKEESVTSSLSKPSLSMAALNRNVKNLSINTKNEAVNASPLLPSPFASSNRNKLASLTTSEESYLATSSINQVLTNACIVSYWNNNKWESIGTEYRNQLKFANNDEFSTMALYTDSDSLIPDLLIPLNNPRTSITKSSALDLQISCFKSIESSKLIMLTIRCRDSKTFTLVKEMLDQSKAYNKDDNKTTISASSSTMDVFSDKPSNSTSMSSITVANTDEIKLLGMPKMYNNHSNSTLSLSHTPTSAVSTSSSSASALTPHNTSDHSLHELLLKNNMKIRLHKLDEDDEWIPVSVGKFNLYSNVANPEYSKFEIKCLNKFKLITYIKNTNCSRIGRSGLKFNSIDPETGDELSYLIEFKNSLQCSDLYDLLQ